MYRTAKPTFENLYQAVKALLRALNPAAVIVEAINGAVPPEAVLGTRLFSLAQVMTCI